MSETRQDRRIESLEALRAISIAMVLVKHFGSLMPRLLYLWGTGGIFQRFQLSAGVDIFFCVSGFVVTRGLLRDMAGHGVAYRVDRAIRFWIRRAFRLWPVAWFWLLAACLLSPYFDRHDSQDADAVLHMLAPGLAMYANAHLLHAAHANQIFGTMAPYWSLSLEEQFYVAVPLLLVFLPRLVMPALITYVAFRWVNYHDFWTNVFMRPGCLFAGVVLAYLEGGVLWRCMRSLPLPGYARASICVLLILAATAANGIGPYDRIAHIPIYRFQAPLESLICFLLVFIAAHHTGSWNESWPRRAFMFLASRSYTLYVVHPAVYAVTREFVAGIPGLRAGGPIEAAILATLGLSLLILATECTVRCIEQPLRQTGRRISETVTLRLVHHGSFE